MDRAAVRDTIPPRPARVNPGPGGGFCPLTLIGRSGTAPQSQQLARARGLANLFIFGYAFQGVAPQTAAI